MKLAKSLKKYTINTGYLFFEKILRAVVSLTVWALVIRYLGPDQFGIFSYALSFVFLFNILSDLGLSTVVVRDLVRNGDKEKEILSTTFFLKLAGSLSAIILIFFTTYVFSFDPYIRKIILIMSTRLIFMSFNYIDFYFQSKVISKYTVYSQILSLLCVSILCLIFVYFRLPLIYFALVVVIEYVVLSIGLIIFYIVKQKKAFCWKFNFSVAKELLKNSWPLIISASAISIYMRIDQIMLKIMSGAASVGYYSAAIRISETFYFIPIVITASLFPAIVKTKSRDDNLYQNLLTALFSILLWLALIIALLATVVSGSLVNMIYGAQYIPAAGVLSLHIWAAIFVFLGVARSKWAINENLQIYLMFYTLIGAVVNILLNLLSIPIWGIKGAAIATVISQAMAAVFSNLFAKKTRPVFILQAKGLNIVRALKALTLWT
ncbi:MAG: flippase [Candidatus Omnitrophica bacterium]|nr:flippase [Candidatus Omnitrophota bacterium]MDD5429413.1 flippase [Candidatus Omnitrophota bacterium]